jgi:hypothetical protein
MPKYLLLILSLLVLQNIFAQQGNLSGKVVDTSENRPLSNAVVSIINPSDSILLKFTRTHDDGSFVIHGITASQYIVLITYPNYADYVDHFSDSSGKGVTMGTVPLTKRSQLLETVVIRQQIAAIRMKGDTLEFKADSFKVSQGSTVDELLKRLPGIQVDRNGQITAQGETVKKVLVDGEEFFSDDPAVVIKNLQAEAVDKVQLYDKKSDQAEFTGIDDGQRSKTINLTLKADKKKGYFGKASLNGGTNHTFDNDLMINDFKGARKMAVFGIMSNTGRAGLDWDDERKFSGGDNVEYNEDEGYFMFSNSGGELNEIIYDKDGLPAAWSAGMHFSNKWNHDNQNINGNYRFLKKNLNSERSTFSQYILPDTQYFSNLDKKSFSTRIGHQVNGTYDLKFDSTSSVKIKLNGTSINSDAISRIQSEALNADSDYVNKSQRLLTSKEQKNIFNASVLWRKKFKKAGRTLSVNFENQYLGQDMNGLLQSNTDYFNKQGQAERQENIDQKKDNTQTNLGLSSNIIYTEPLTKVLFLSLNYGFNFQKTEALRNSFNKGENNYDIRDSLFSNDFRFGYDVQRAGADIKFSNKKILMILGSGISHANYRQTDLRKDSARSYSFLNYNPKFSIRLTPRAGSRLSLTYNGRTNPPDLDQLQPVAENSDPLNIQLGNPALRQEFEHRVTVDMYDFKLLSERNMYFFSSAQFTDNAISTSTVVDAGKTTVQPINVDGTYNVSVYTGYMMKLKKANMYVGVRGVATTGRFKNRLNNLDNINNNKSYSLSFYLDKRENEKYSFSLGPEVAYTISKSSLRPDIQTKFLSGIFNFDAWIKLPQKFEFNTNANVNLRQKTDVFDRNNNYTKWDASLVKKLLKNNNLQLKITVSDILNQNIGFDRTATTNIVAENRFLTLKRYWLVGVQYNISKNP